MEPADPHPSRAALPYGGALLLFLLLPAGGFLSAQSPADACGPDASRFCADAIPDPNRVFPCLQAHALELSPECLRVLRQPPGASSPGASGFIPAGDRMRAFDDKVMRDLFAGMPCAKQDVRNLLVSIPPDPPESMMDVIRAHFAPILQDLIPDAQRSGDACKLSLAAVYAYRVGIAIRDPNLVHASAELANAAVTKARHFSTAYSVRAYIRGRQNDFDGLKEDAKTALHLNPSDQAAKDLATIASGQQRIPAPWEGGGQSADARRAGPAPDDSGAAQLGAGDTPNMDLLRSGPANAPAPARPVSFIANPPPGVPPEPAAPPPGREPSGANADKGGSPLPIILVVVVSTMVGSLAALFFGWTWLKRHGLTTATPIQLVAPPQTTPGPPQPGSAPALPAPEIPLLARTPAAPSEGPSALRGQYELVRTIGRGGMGVVYEARDKALERRVAVKKMRDEIRDDPRERERFLREAKLVASLHHPAIVDIYAIVADGADLAIVFEYVDGQTLDAFLQSRGRLDLEMTRRILHHVCAALEFAHAQNVIHRDLKPSNIMLSTHGIVKVMDFGIARQAKDSMSKFSMTATVMGTPLYMPPEAEQGVVCRESDLYSLGAMTYEMVVGRPPYPPPATSEQKRARSYPKASTLVPGLPPAFDALIDAALEPDPAKRVHSAAEFRARLDAAA